MKTETGFSEYIFNWYYECCVELVRNTLIAIIKFSSRDHEQFCMTYSLTDDKSPADGDI